MIFSLAGGIMLIRFKVGNFKSFGDVQEISMLAGKVQNKSERVYKDEKIKLLKYAQIFGANASGKSNMVEALDFFRDTVIDKFPDGYSYLYNKCSSLNKNKTSYFEIEIKIEDKYYAYGFEALLNEGKFTSEWLFELDNKKETIIFSRDILASTYAINTEIKDEELIKRLNIYLQDIEKDYSVLFLKNINTNKKEFFETFKEALPLQNVFDWLRRKLDINYPDQPVSLYSYFAHKSNINQIVEAIKAFSTGIIDYKIIETTMDTFLKNVPIDLKNKILADIEKASSQQKDAEHNFVLRGDREFFMISIVEGNIKCETIQFEHENSDNLFLLSEESDGTARILDLLEILLNNSNKVFVIDEIDRCLHPQLTRKFIEIFLEYAKGHNTQLIVTTHESRLLDLDLVRRDEIWFIEKSNCGNSKVYSLEEYNTRFDQRVDKAYLDGRYGGIPIFNKIFPNIGEDL